MYCGSAENWCLTKCTIEVQCFLGRDTGGSEVRDGSALGFCYRNSVSSRWNSYCCIVFVQEIGA